MPSKVYVTGLGIISAMGVGVSETLRSFSTEKTFVRHPEILKTLLKEQYPLGEVRFSNEELKSLLKINSKQSFSRTSLLALIAAKEALFSSRQKESPLGIGVISGTSVGGMDKGEYLYDGYIRKNGKFNLHDAFVHDCGDSTNKIVSYLGTQAYSTTISTACSSAANAIMLGARLIKAGKLQRVIAGGTDALTRFTLSGFRSLMILSDEYCKPFDQNRKGLNLGEGAGYIVLESEEILNKENRKPICELTGYANTCDAFHQTASSPDGNGAWLAISQALALAGLNAEEISYVNTHGTATPNNDLSESMAMKRVFGEKMPPFSSTKSFTGHTLGAAGGIEAVFSALSIRDKIIFPNLHFQDKMEETGIQPTTDFKKEVEIKHVLSNSFGFGGNNSSLVFSAC